MLQTVMEGVGWDGMIKDVQQKTPTITTEITGDHLKHPHLWGHV